MNADKVISMFLACGVTSLVLSLCFIAGLFFDNPFLVGCARFMFGLK